MVSYWLCYNLSVWFSEQLTMIGICWQHTAAVVVTIWYIVSFSLCAHLWSCCWWCSGLWLLMLPTLLVSAKLYLPSPYFCCCLTLIVWSLGLGDHYCNIYLLFCTCLYQCNCKLFCNAICSSKSVDNTLIWASCSCSLSIVVVYLCWHLAKWTLNSMYYVTIRILHGIGNRNLEMPAVMVWVEMIWWMCGWSTHVYELY